MNKTKLILFKVQDKVVEKIEGNEVTIEEVESIKSSIAVIHGVSFDDIDIDTEDIYLPELSKTWIVRDDGMLMAKVDNPYASFREVTGLRPALDITKPELFGEFLELIFQEKFCEAITFN
jgi:hypothetical protein